MADLVEPASGAAAVSSADVDAWLKPALDALVNSRPGISILVVPWGELPAPSLLPFHLHIRWPAKITWLPLNASLAYLPFLNDQLSELRLYPALASEKWRKKARAERHAGGELENDLACPDWERAIGRNREEFTDSVLPGACYVSVDAAASSGGFRRGSRGVLGRRSSQDLLRPRLLTCSRGEPTSEQLEELLGVDLAIVDLQGATGTKTFELTKALLRGRSTTKRTLLIASAPSDLTPIAECLGRHTQAFLGGPIATGPAFNIHPVGNDRALADRRLDFALKLEPGAPPAAHFLAHQASHAWWALRQSVSGDNSSSREHATYLRLLASLADSDSHAARQFALATELLATAASGPAAQERRDAVVAIALSAPGVGDTAVLVRNETQATGLRTALAAALGVPAESLAKFGLYVRPYYWQKHNYRATNCILSGYFGRRSIDAALRCSPSVIHFVADGTELRVAWAELRKQRDLIRSVSGLGDLANVIEPLLQSLEGSTTASGPATALELTSTAQENYSFDPSDAVLLRPPAGNVSLAFTDGTIVTVAEGTRFEVLGRVGGVLTTKQARDLERGDETIILNDHSQARFSEFVLEALDEGPLKSLAAKRAQWLMLVKASVDVNQSTPATIFKKLAAAGHDVDRATVRTWVAFDASPDGAVPRTLKLFGALATALEILLPEALLVQMFDAIRRVRTIHRLAGRELARAIRFAHLGILDAPSQERLKRTWGIEPRRLFEAARIARVDQVLR